VAVEDAAAAGILLALSGTLAVLSLLSFRRYRSRSFLSLAAAFLLVFAEGIGIGLVALDVITPGNFPLFLIAILQAASLILIYVATLPRG